MMPVRRSLGRMRDNGSLMSFGLMLIVLGMIIVFLALFLVFFEKGGRGKVSGGGALIIGPIPIVFGTDKKALKAVLSLSIVLTLLLLILMIVNYVMR